MMRSSRRLGLGILASGSGTNLQAIIDAAASGNLDAEVRIVISDVAGAQALTRALHHGIPTATIERAAFPSRQAFEAAIVETLRQHDAELICLAGFMRIIGKELLAAYPERIMNIHPALLPSFPGLEGQQQAFDYGVKIAGCTVHFVDAKTDHGPIICQAAVAVYEDDTVERLATRILVEEHKLYPQAIQLFAEGRLHIRGRHVSIDPKEDTR